MSKLAQQAREAMRAKAHRLAHGHEMKVDSTSVDLPEPGDGSRKVVDRQRVPTRKDGGKVEGHHAKMHAGRRPRGKKADGGMAETPAESTARYKREKAEADAGSIQQKMFASERKDGPKFEPDARKRGGKVHSDEAEDRKLIDKMVKPSARTGKKDGGVRAERKSGGRTKAKTSRIPTPCPAPALLPVPQAACPLVAHQPLALRPRALPLPAACPAQCPCRSRFQCRRAPMARPACRCPARPEAASCMRAPAADPGASRKPKSRNARIVARAAIHARGEGPGVLKPPFPESPGRSHPPQQRGNHDRLHDDQSA